MSWISRVTLGAGNREELRQLRGLKTMPYAQHQALWSLFDKPRGSLQPFVFRQMVDDSDDTLRFLMVSDDRPRVGDVQWRIESKPYRPQLQPGQCYRFNVRLNPTRSEKVVNGRGKRQDYVISRLHQLQVPTSQRAAERQRIVHEELPQWLRARGETRGFMLEQCAVESFEVQRLRKGEHAVTLSTTEFSGGLTVVDPEKLSVVLREGLGHGRSFGLGLLLLRPW